MDPRSPGGMLLAPAASTAAALRAPGRDEALPPVDAVTLKEDSRREIIDGYVVEVMSSEEPHATLHSRIDRVLGPCVRDDHEIAVDMLTRTNERNEFAPDVSVFPKERDPATGGRKIEALAFEVIDTTRLAEVTDKAQKLIARGVRRVFVVDVNAHTLSEWSVAQGRWQPLGPQDEIKDRCLAAPVVVAALLDAAQAEWAIVRGLKARKAPALLKEIAEGEKRGEKRGEERGTVEGERQGLRPLARLFERKMGRVLTSDEQARLQTLLHALGPERLGDVALDLTGDELARRLTDVDAR